MTPRTALAGLLVCTLTAGVAAADGWPNRTFRFVTRAEPAPHVHRKVPCYGRHSTCAPHPAYRADWHSVPKRTSPPRPSTLAEARAMLEADQLEAAQSALRQLTRSTPQDPEVWALLGRADRRLGHYTAASESLRRAIAIDPGHPGALAEQGQVFLATGRPALARETLATLVQSCGRCAETAALRSALTGAGYHEGGTGAKRVRVQP